MRRICFSAWRRALFIRIHRCDRDLTCWRSTRRPNRALWPYGISGDLPILVVRIDEAADLPTVRKLVRGHEYLHYKGLKIDLVILNDNPTTYLQLLQKELETMVRTSGLGVLQDKPGGVFLRRTDQMPEGRSHPASLRSARCDRLRARTARGSARASGGSRAAAGRFCTAPAFTDISGADRGAAGVDFLQRTRWLSSGWTRVCDSARRGTMDTRALGKHYRQQK